jgi:hypothetical protein
VCTHTNHQQPDGVKLVLRTQQRANAQPQLHKLL